METVTCETCGKVCVPNGYTTEYGIDEHGKKHCFDCCTWRELVRMRDTGKATLYLTLNNGNSGHITDWANGFRIPVSARKGRHNIAGSCYHVWFRAFGRNWHGVQYGENTQILHCRAVK